VSALGVQAQDSDQLPEYAPGPPAPGTIRVWGNDFTTKLQGIWEVGFRKFQPGIQFEDNLVSSAAATGALFTKTAEIGVVGREIRPMEVAGYTRVMNHKPLVLR
jgi:phosphate transport system substrate-binding protein